MNIAVESWVIEFLADHIRNNVRRLEGALMRVASYKSLSDREITREVIENLLRDIFQEQARRAVTIEQIQRKVAEHFDVRLADMTSKRRPANIAFPRQVAMFLSRELTNSSLSDIGDAFGGKDHGTVIHACKLDQAPHRGGRANPPRRPSARESAPTLKHRCSVQSEDDPIEEPPRC